MDTERIVVGLDIGTTKVVAIVGRLNGYGNVDVLGLGKAESEGVTRGVIDNIDKTVAAIQAAIHEAERQANVEINLVHVGIAGEHIRTLKHKGIITLSNPDQEITLADVERLRADMFKVAVPPGTEILHVIPQDYSVDSHHDVKDPVGMSGVRLEGNFQIITCQSLSARNIYKCVRKAGLEVEELVLQPLASAHAVLSDEEKEAGVCLVDIGGGTTDLVIFENNIIRHTAVIPFGGSIITEDIKQGCSVMRKQAEYLKRTFGAALAQALTEDEIITISGLSGRPPKEIMRRTLAGIIQARMEEILDLVVREIVAAGFQHRLVGGIVVTGGGAELVHLADLVSYVTGIDCRVGYPTEHLAKGMVEEVSHPFCATGMGLVVYGLKAEEVNVSGGSREPQPQRTKEPVGAGFLGKIKTWFEGSLANSGPTLD
ncbi:MAG: cell division protein FtsA [Bacteroidia bacterium]|nr:cell division protein FtsA [Bacteroidia bacterium]